jgi:hypothetical protein
MFSTKLDYSTISAVVHVFKCVRTAYVTFLKLQYVAWLLLLWVASFSYSEIVASCTHSYSILYTYRCLLRPSFSSSYQQGDSIENSKEFWNRILHTKMLNISGLSAVCILLLICIQSSTLALMTRSSTKRISKSSSAFFFNKVGGGGDDGSKMTKSKLIEERKTPLPDNGNRYHIRIKALNGIQERHVSLK